MDLRCNCTRAIFTRASGNSLTAGELLRRDEIVEYSDRHVALATPGHRSLDGAPLGIRVFAIASGDGGMYICPRD